MTAPGKQVGLHLILEGREAAKEEELDGHSQPLAQVLTAEDCRPTLGHQPFSRPWITLQF